MKFAGWQRTTLIDFPGMISTVLFTQGCSMRCRFCHNPQLVSAKDIVASLIDEEEIFQYLKKRKTMLEGVIITGGEPTIQPELPKFIKQIHDMGFKIKLDTNGYQPESLQKLIKTGCIDYIAMDVKSTAAKYSYITGLPIHMDRIQKSLDILARSNIPYELRTTAVKPLLSLEDLKTIAQEIQGAPLWILQQFRSVCTLDPTLINEEGYKEEEILALIPEVSPRFVKECRLR